MRTVTAGHASQSFDELLDQVEAGETILVTRGGKGVASIEPNADGNGAEVLALLLNAHVDDEFARDVAVAWEY
ncbi:MAG: prevent-host-death family protein [Frankiales bacterium]|nr:prevent-host-death family protein [Frankiales bacterium]